MEHKFFSKQDVIDIGELIEESIKKNGFSDKFLLVILNPNEAHYVGSACMVCTARELTNTVIDNGLQHHSHVEPTATVIEDIKLEEKGQNVTDKKEKREELKIVVSNPNIKTKH